MTSDSDFRRELLLRSGDRTLRHVYADWCEEQGQSAQARYLRTIRDEKFARRIDRWKLGDLRCCPFTGKRVQIPEVVGRFAEYYRNHGAWGVLHVALDDGNIRESDVTWIALYSDKTQYDQNGLPYFDSIGVELAFVLRSMTLTQRGKLDQLCEWLLHIDGEGTWSSWIKMSSHVVAARVANWADFVARVGRRVQNSPLTAYQGASYHRRECWADGDHRDYEAEGG